MKKILAILAMVFIFANTAQTEPPENPLPSGGTVNTNFIQPDYRIFFFCRYPGEVWADANKSSADDTQMCWAGSASNMLYMAGWADDFDSEDEVFDHFVDHWTDRPGWMLAACKWWFDGTNLYEGSLSHSQIDVEGGGAFWPELDIFDFYVVRSFYNSGQELAVPFILELLESGHAVSIAVSYKTPDTISSPIPGFLDAHALTVWGYEKNYYGEVEYLYITNTDDMEYALVREEVECEEGYWYIRNGWIYSVQGLIIKGSEFLYQYKIVEDKLK